MQETRNVLTNELRQEIFRAPNKAELSLAMDADVRKNEVVTRRQEVSDSEGMAIYETCILRELLAIPSAVFDRPIFAKLNRYLKNYREMRSRMSREEGRNECR